MFKLDKEYLFKLKSMPRGRNSSTPISNTCRIPYSTVTVDYNSNCFICSCDGWLPIPVGKVRDFETLDDVWSSPIARMLQNDIDSKNFTWCAVDHCNIRHANLALAKSTLKINIDESCNLSCPSCRRSPVMHSAGEFYNTKLQDMQHILTWLEKFNRPLVITLSGNGDPFASHIIRPLIQSYQPNLKHKFQFRTNGLLLKKQLSTSPLVPHIETMEISVDAGSKNVYEDVRRPGKWEVLLENLDYLNEIKISKKTILYFCLQDKNFKDLLAFNELCNSYGVKGIVHQLDDWGTWNTSEIKNPDDWTVVNGTYQDHNVANPKHPNYKNMISLLNECSKTKLMLSPYLQRLLKNE